jgi:ketosteroid isomerase-like protein
MSQENVELIKRMVGEATNNPAAMYKVLAEDVEWDVSDLQLPGRSVYRGHAGVMEFFRDWVGAFDEWGYQAEELIDAGDATVVRLHQWGRGKGSGAAVEIRFWQVWNLRGGEVVRASHHLEKDQALEAAGLRE